jgi:DNA-directed RNA polymerase specialized sigma24 family protein
LQNATWFDSSTESMDSVVEEAYSAGSLEAIVIPPGAQTMPEPAPTSSLSRRQGFATTQWSIVAAAGDQASAVSREALAALCDSYWYPLYAYIRRCGYGPDEAEDLTQEFFARLLEKHWLRVADRERGRFRSFILASLKHFLANERDRERTLKRGGGVIPLSLDLQAAEGRFALEPGHDLTPDRVFERRWILTLLERVLGELRTEMAASGYEERFERLKEFLTGGSAGDSYARAAADLAMTEANVKVTVHRLRKRYGALLRQEVGRTVADPRDVDDEIRGLLAALGA